MHGMARKQSVFTKVDLAKMHGKQTVFNKVDLAKFQECLTAHYGQVKQGKNKTHQWLRCKVCCMTPAWLESLDTCASPQNPVKYKAVHTNVFVGGNAW